MRKHKTAAEHNLLNLPESAAPEAPRADRPRGQDARPQASEWNPHGAHGGRGPGAGRIGHLLCRPASRVGPGTRGSPALHGDPLEKDSDAQTKFHRGDARRLAAVSTQAA